MLLSRRYAEANIHLQPHNMATMVEEYWGLLPHDHKVLYEQQAQRQHEDHQRQRAHYLKALREYKRIAVSIGQSGMVQYLLRGRFSAYCM